MPEPPPRRARATLYAPRYLVRREVYRKTLHTASIALPLFVWLVPRAVALAVLVSLVLVALLVEVARKRSRWARYHFLRRTRTLLRPRERRGLAGATYMAIAYTLAVFLFPKPVAVAAMLYNGLGDAAAALVGRRWGRLRIWRGKSLEGAVAGLVVMLLIGVLLPGIPPGAAVVGAVTAALLELADLPPDDNLWVTLGGAVGLWVGLGLGGHG